MFQECPTLVQLHQGVGGLGHRSTNWNRPYGSHLENPTGRDSTLTKDSLSLVTRYHVGCRVARLTLTNKHILNNPTALHISLARYVLYRRLLISDAYVLYFCRHATCSDAVGLSQTGRQRALSSNTFGLRCGPRPDI